MKSLRKSLTFLFLTMALVFAFSVNVSAAPSVSAASAVVLDGDTGACYYDKNADIHRAPASLTKLMTAYVIFEEIDSGRISYDSPVTISAHGSSVAYTAGYSNVPLNKGEQYTVDTMLKLILLPSACGACAAMGDYISGSESSFVARMNQTAAELGMTAHYQNTYGAGVSMSNHYVTARSMAILASSFIQKHPDILKYTSLSSITFKGKTYRNTNKFLGSDYYAGVDGMKTGTSNAAGSCITVSAKQNGRRLIVVVLKSDNRYGDGRKLLDYGFSCIKTNDAAVNNAVYTITSPRKDIRLGADFTVNATVSAASNSFVASGGWTVNGKTVKTFDQTAMGNGSVISATLNLDAYAGSDVTLGFYVNLPDGSVKTTEATYAFSTEEACAFRDIDGHWAENAITVLKAGSVLSGYEDGTFHPENTVTRAEFVTMLSRILVARGDLEVTDGEVSGFADTAGHWGDKYIAAMKKQNIVAGVGENCFAPEAKVTRQEIAAFLARAFDYESEQTTREFKDHGDISSWALASVAACTEQGVITGYPDDTFRPQNNATRAESAMLLSKCK